MTISFSSNPPQSTPQFGNNDTENKVSTLRDKLADELTHRLDWALQEVPVDSIPGGKYGQATKNHIALATQKAAIITAAATLATTLDPLNFNRLA